MCKKKPANSPTASSDLERFTKAERLLHWSTALAVLFLLVTGAVIWQHADDWEILGINVFSQSHVWVGGLLLLAGVITYALSSRRRIPFAQKRFSIPQRLALKLMQVLLTVMTASGTVLYLREFIPMSRAFRDVVRGVHFWSMVPVLAFVAVHLMAVLAIPKNRGLLRGMLTGQIARNVAMRLHPEWVRHLGDPSAQATPNPLADPAGGDRHSADAPQTGRSANLTIAP